MTKGWKCSSWFSGKVDDGVDSEQGWRWTQTQDLTLVLTMVEPGISLLPRYIGRVGYALKQQLELFLPSSLPGLGGAHALPGLFCAVGDPFLCMGSLLPGQGLPLELLLMGLGM
ncbi:unnamed protein product, partial [Prunus brigantina]